MNQRTSVREDVVGLFRTLFLRVGDMDEEFVEVLAAARLGGSHDSSQKEIGINLRRPISTSSFTNHKRKKHTINSLSATPDLAHTPRRITQINP